MKAPLRSPLLPLFLVLFTSSVRAQDVGVFEVHFGADAFAKSADNAFEGDVFIAFGGEREPREEMHGWFNAPPVMRFDMKGTLPGAVVRVSLGDAVALHPASLGQDAAHAWKVQAVARRSRTGRQVGLSAGDVYSEVLEISYLATSEGVAVLHLDQIVQEEPFAETDRVRGFDFVSPSLSKFHGFDYTMHAGVLLPKEYDASRTYPVLYSVTGFGSDHRGIARWQRSIPEGSPLEQCIVVIPDANNRYGHSVFCDSATNGPWGQALVHELIPALEREFKGAGPAQRYVTGVSSGGWSSLWLQVTYPDAFNGCWSHVPDPIDFHDFQQINLYEPLADGSARNMYVDEQGEKRPVARRGTEVLLTYEDFVRREDVLNPGGQIRSFEATFSPRLADGTPRRVFDVKTGTIDRETAKAWRKYDISNTLLTRWDELRPKLAGKIHVYAGGVDTFYLEGAVERFQALAREKGLLEDMVIEVVPELPHTQHAAGFANMLEVIEAGMAVPAGD